MPPPVAKSKSVPYKMTSQQQQQDITREQLLEFLDRPSSELFNIENIDTEAMQETPQARRPERESARLAREQFGHMFSDTTSSPTSTSTALPPLDSPDVDPSPGPKQTRAQRPATAETNSFNAAMNIIAGMPTFDFIYLYIYVNIIQYIQE